MRAPTLATLIAIVPLILSTQASLVVRQETDLCLQRKFLSAELCTDIDPSYSNETLPTLGWYCCWYQGPFAPPPATPVSAWLTFDDDGNVANRCLGSGTCEAGLPDGKS
ncbi:hypothetical protein F4779DRAFT_593440 [Xylariaceae sp. FL0662B]|nr:hypothetical protein F4779DRAFT_593440 [Xylariaceae sp. FL0662B]